MPSGLTVGQSDQANVRLKRLLVTGRHGFVGGVLARMVASDPTLNDWHLCDIAPDFDLRDVDACAELVADARPDAVIHLAAQSFVPESFRDPAETFDVNVIGTLRLLQALQQQKFSGPMLYVGTGDVYGLVPEAALPISESRAPAPRNPYAVSKLAAEALCFQWSVTEGASIVMARSFNHIGPGQSDRFVIADFAHQLAEIAAGRRDPVVAVGDIDVTRDFTDVRDVVRAYFALLDRGRSGEIYNVCSGVERSIRSLLERLMELSGVTARIEPQNERLRRAEQRRVAGSPARICAATGWSATTPVDESLVAMLEYWKNEKKAGN
jgi:GDP-4-dehydro-6-deoxy-D-mannose reductase